MKFEQIYLSSPKSVQSLMVIAYGYVLRHRRLGGPFFNYLKTLQQQEKLQSKNIQSYQEAKLRTLVAHAFAHVPYYRDLSSRLRLRVEDVTLSTLSETLPILEKEEVRRDPSRFISTEPTQGLLQIYTSGTTGSPLSVSTTRDALRTNYAFFYRFLDWHGVSPASRSATFAGRPLVSPNRMKPPFWRQNPAFNNVQFSSYHLSPSNLSAYVEKLRRWQPDYIDAYPSSISVIAKHLLATGQNGIIRPRVIVTSSETLSAADREAIQTAFQCPVRNQYGSAEMAAFVSECENGRLHVAPDYGIVELLPFSGEPGQSETEIIATGFINPTMPLLRYRTGDCAVPGTANCPCGRAFPVISDLLGRSDDVIVAPDGTLVGRLDPIFKDSPGILESQIIQVAIDRIVVKAVLVAGQSQECLQPMLKALKARLPNSIRVSTEIVGAIPRTANGKVRAVISRIDRPPASKPYPENDN